MSIDKTLVSNEIKKFSPSHIIIGYSGGIDSSVLLNIAKDLNTPIIAIYINHNVHPNALEWQTHCQKTCDKYNIKFISHSLEQVPKGESFEAWASKQRMSFFQQEMKNYSNPLLLLGHHLDDQAETFLIQAMRGSGLAGLAGIPYYKKLNIGAILRPLLNYKKSDTEAFAQQNNIDYIYDDSNLDIKYRRNLIRNEVIPILQQVNPNISETLSRSANICGQSNNILNKLITEKLDQISQNDNITISKLISLDNDIQKSIIHFWFKKITSQSLKNKQVQDIYLGVNNASTGWKININPLYDISIEYDQLLIKDVLKPTTFSAKHTEILKWLKTQTNKDYDLNKLTIRDRQSDDKCKYPGRNKANKLKVLFQELKIPALERSNTKIILYNEKIVAVYPFFICPD
ncbi:MULTISPECIES: tRNA lysidine(34) synthetase TilS [unclassified Francisella]|uniref:tRNA lysidine(34) synthetase TilS n=1 Tax=unclassified Francisella TaxID=2610885 RepID=UPI002E3610D8|nr:MULTISPECIES: tRNA lysidine(34) synthetase TilS [unclassified Francisella]MED7819233.1 tRNA lysidine(34) synthetase TilS [Francisella sp. 19S2-4]MED7830022.1 tRNA lysidine(34) synthetase TilS [Francisella sp. 19S2-10]